MPLGTIPASKSGLVPQYFQQLVALTPTPIATSQLPDGSWEVYATDPSDLTGNKKLPPPQAVLDALVNWNPAPTIPLPDVSNASGDGQVAAAVQSLQSYLANASPTGADAVAVLKPLIRVVLWILRRMIALKLFPQ